MACAVAARNCYSERGPLELEKQISKQQAKKVIETVVSAGHESVLEYADFMFAIEGVSRALLAQLTRHRLASYAVKGQRYVVIKGPLSRIVPHSIKEKGLEEEYNAQVDKAKELYDRMLAAGIPAEDARYILPEGTETQLVLKMNARELRNFFTLRCCNKAQWEIARLACDMLKLVKRVAPNLFVSAGPECARSRCKETRPCGKPWKKV
jgi:thymidylate synthase (FAD)